MKKSVLAPLALGAALAFIPSALADSFGYKYSDLIVANHSFDNGQAGFANGVMGGGAYIFTGVSEGYPVNKGVPVSLGLSGREGIDTGSYANSLKSTANGGFIFENILYHGNSENAIPEGGDVLVDIGGHELNLFSGSFGGGEDTIAKGDGHFYFADRGNYQINNEISKGRNDLLGATATLAATPEPGSLLLLGTGLLCLALVLFRKAAKRSTGS